MRLALLFPGQGSQFVGMGADLFDQFPGMLGGRADEVLGWSLRDLCLNGPEDALTRTEHAQPALFALSYLLWTMLESELAEPPAGAAGHSLGEYTALAASGAVEFETGLRLVATRGREMAAAADLEPSGMAALLGVDLEVAESVTVSRRETGGRLQVANINAPGQIVVAGGAEDIEWLVENGPAMGIKRVVPLKVAGAFHSPFMDQAATRLESTLVATRFEEPRFPVWSNTTGIPHRLDGIADTLIRQVVSPVRFTDCLSDMAGSGITVFAHIGPGDVTAGMARKTIPDATVLRISALEDVRPAIDALGTM